MGAAGILEYMLRTPFATSLDLDLRSVPQLSKLRSIWGWTLGCVMHAVSIPLTVPPGYNGKPGLCRRPLVSKQRVYGLALCTYVTAAWLFRFVSDVVLRVEWLDLRRLHHMNS